MAAAFAATVIAAPGRSYVGVPPPRNAGGFGEPTCAECHRGAAAGTPAAELEIVAPAAWRAGEEVVVEVRLRREGVRRAGFQLTARLAAGADAGAQAGHLLPLAETVQVVPAHAVAYASHTARGTRVDPPGEARWRLRWQPPPAGAGAVVLHAAANAADDDDSALGDTVTSAVVTVPEAAPRR